MKCDSPVMSVGQQSCHTLPGGSSDWETGLRSYRKCQLCRVSWRFQEGLQSGLSIRLEAVWLRTASLVDSVCVCVCVCVCGVVYVCSVCVCVVGSVAKTINFHDTEHHGNLEEARQAHFMEVHETVCHKPVLYNHHT